MAASISNYAEGGERYHNLLGGNAVLRNGLLIFVSLLALMTDVLLVLFARSVRPASFLAVSLYLFPAFHLLPWVAGLQFFRMIGKALKKGTIGAAGANLAYSAVLALLVATYVALGSGEQLGIAAYRLLNNR